MYISGGVSKWLHKIAEVRLRRYGYVMRRPDDHVIKNSFHRHKKEGQRKASNDQDDEFSKGRESVGTPRTRRSRYR